jgi:hypothetical protein
MMNCKGFDRNRSWSNFKALSGHSIGGNEENHEIPQSGLRAEILTWDIPYTKQEC